MPERDLQNELDSLRAETLALQLILIALLSKMLATSHVGQIVIPSLDQAADRATITAMAARDRVSPEHTGKALEIVEQLRTAIVGDDPKPRKGE